MHTLNVYKQIFGLYKAGTRFVDLTEEDGTIYAMASPVEFPTTVRFHNKTLDIIESISKSAMTQFLTKFTSFKTRYFRSTTGVQSAEWLFGELTALAKESNRSDVSLKVSKFEHSWGQFSIIASLEPTEGISNDIAIVSAHQDSVNGWNPFWGASPGADDDGSGTVTIFEALRCLLAAEEFVPTRTIQWHFYSAEEGGLLGSQKVAQSYISKLKIPVFGVFHIDMTGYAKPGTNPVVALATDFTSKPLTEFVSLVVAAYSDIDLAYTECGYACSDHASWTKHGVPAAFAFEGPFEDHSPYIHTTDDTVDHIDFDHVAEFVKSVIGFVIESSAN